MPLLGLLVNVLIVLLIVGLILYVVSVIPCPTELLWIKQVFRVVVIVFACIWFISLLAGWAPPIGNYPVGRPYR
jgi:hypothetical protein